jgi:hypothetical protein
MFASPAISEYEPDLLISQWQINRIYFRINKDRNHNLPVQIKKAMGSNMGNEKGGV